MVDRLQGLSVERGGRAGRKRTSTVRRRALVEQLEARQMLAAILPGGVLQIEGGPGNDSIQVTLSGAMVVVDQNDTISTFPQASVNSITVRGNEGDDFISAQAGTIPASLDGGAGNDEVNGGEGNDQITGGPGRDTLRGGGGNDRLEARDGEADIVDGGGGYDQAVTESIDRYTTVEAVQPYTPAADNQPITVKILVLNYEPSVPSELNRPLHEVMNWSDPRALASQYAEAIERTSGGFVHMEIVEWRDLNEVPGKVDGFRYTPDEYVTTIRTGSGIHDPDLVDYYRMMEEQNVATRINSGAVDEVWYFAAPYFGGWEAAMMGPQSFFINGGVYPDIATDRAFAVMGFNYERSLEEMLEDNMHRIENHIGFAYGGWDITHPKTAWDRFTANYGQSPMPYGVGSAHYPANADADYDWGDPRVVQSTADDWYNYPNLTGATTLVSRDTWTNGGLRSYGLGYREWFHEHLPRNSGRDSEGRLNNWWKYIYDFNQYNAFNGQARTKDAVLGSATLTQAGDATYELFVRYYDGTGIDGTSIDAGDLEVTGPDGARLSVELLSVGQLDQRSEGFARTARYRIAAPGGVWGMEDNGIYLVSLRKDQIKDGQGAYFPAKPLGDMRVEIPQPGRLDINSMVAAGTASVTGTQADIGGLSSVFDGNRDTLLRTPAINPATIKIEFQSPQTVLAFATLFFAENRWMVESADSNADLLAKAGTYRVLVPWTFKADDNTMQTERLATAATAKVFRLTVERTAGDDYVHIREWQLIGPAAEDHDAPAAELVSTAISTSGGTAYFFDVNYTDATSVDESTLGPRDLTVQGPNGFSQNAVFYGDDSYNDGTRRRATYDIVPPGGYWDWTDNGTYSVILQSQAVADTVGNRPSSERTLGTFTVNIAPPQTYPPAELTENNASQWSAWAEGASASASDDTSRRIAGAASVKLSTTGGFDNAWSYPRQGAAHWDLSTFTSLAFAAFAENLNDGGFQEGSPWIRLGDYSGNYYEYRHYQNGWADNPLNDASNQWKEMIVDLLPDNTLPTGWRRTEHGSPQMSGIEYVEFHADTWDAGFTVWLDGLTFVGDSPVVTVNQKVGQADPAKNGLIYFAVDFSAPVNDFNANSMVLSGPEGTRIESITGGPANYEVAVSAIERGEVSISVPAGRVHDAGGHGNLASVNIDNTVSYLGWSAEMPWLDGLSDLTVLEDSLLRKVGLSGIASGLQSKKTLQVTAASSNPTLIPTPKVEYKSPATTGSLSFKPALDQFGTSVITVTVRDPGSDGKWKTADDETFWQNFTVNVTPVNDRPVFKKGRDVSVSEDSGAASIAKWLDPKSVSVGPANESGQTATFVLTVDKPELFAQLPAIDSATGRLSFVPAKDVFGVATIGIALKDNGGTSNGGMDTSAVQTFKITISAINDPPSFAKGSDIAVLQNSGAAKFVGWATSISPGPANEAAQKVSFAATNDNPKLFSQQPAIAADGTLTFTPAKNANGRAVVTVRVKDNGGKAKGGQDTSLPHTFTIVVQPVNFALGLTRGSGISLAEGEASQDVPGWAKSVSAGPADEAGQGRSELRTLVVMTQPEVLPRTSLVMARALLSSSLVKNDLALLSVLADLDAGMTLDD